MPVQRSITESLVEAQLPGSRLLEVWRLVDWDPVAAELEPDDNARQDRRGGPTPWPGLILFRALLLQHWFQLSLSEIERALAYRYDFAVFAGLEPGRPVPSGSTLCRARDRWRAREGGAETTLTRCAQIVEQQLATHGVKILPRRAPVLDVKLLRR